MDSEYSGMYRSKVVSNKDPSKFGRILVWIPDLMPDIPENKGIWARPANNPIGGRNTQYGSDNHFMGSCLIPRTGAYVWIFFENGNINRPYYFGGLDIEQSKVLPENQVGTNYQDKWTIFKSHRGRAIVISDDADDCRTEITGRKRQMNNPPSGDTASVYKIDGNQTTILLDERQGKEKILIRTYKGDFIHIDIDQRKLQFEFNGDIVGHSNGSINVTATNDINLKSLNGNVNIQANVGSVNIKSGNDLNIESTTDMNLFASSDVSIYATAMVNLLADGNLNMDANIINEQCGASTQASGASDATTAIPEGDRDT